MDSGDMRDINLIIARHLNVDFSTLRPEMPLGNLPGGLGTERQDIVDILVALGDEFSFDVMADDVDSLNTVQDIYDYVEGKVEED